MFAQYFVYLTRAVHKVHHRRLNHLKTTTLYISVGHVVLHKRKHHNHNPQRNYLGAQIAHNNSNQTGIHSN